MGAPVWLERWGYLAGVVGILTVAIAYIPVARLSPYVFLIVPVGLGWLIAAGVVLLRRAARGVASRLPLFRPQTYACIGCRPRRAPVAPRPLSPAN